MSAYTEFSYFIRNARDHYLSDFVKTSHNVVVIGSSMNISLLILALTTAVSVGLGCGTGYQHISLFCSNQQKVYERKWLHWFF